MARRRKLTCQFCGDSFKACTYNRHHQICCGRAPCLRALASLRQRRHRALILSDPALAQAYRKKEAEHQQRQRRGHKLSSGPPTSKLAWLSSNEALSMTLIGVAAQMLNSSDAEDVCGLITKLSIRGTQVSRGP